MKKRAVILCVFQLIVISFVYAQITERKFDEEQTYEIDGTHLLETEYSETADFLKANPDFFEKTRLNKSSAWNFTVGTQKRWYAKNFSSGQKYQTATICRGVGEKCYIFVEDSEWGRSVDQMIIDTIITAFDKRTPANPTKGIYQLTIETFGNIPDVDNDPKVIIVLLDIRDGGDRENGVISGYFDPSSEVFHNFAEMFFLDPIMLGLMTKNKLQSRMRTVAHEFQHMIHWNYHQTTSQLSFINEGCSTIAAVVNGYTLYDQKGYMEKTNTSLFAWRKNPIDDVLVDYSRAARFTLYLYDQYGIDILKYIVQSSKYGMDAYLEALSKVGYNISFGSLLENWFIANNLDDKTVNPVWGYEIYPNLPKAYGLIFYNPNVKIESAIENYAVEYITFKAGENLKVRFSTSSKAIKIKAIKTGSSKKEVVDIPLNSEVSIPEFGSNCSIITFAVMNPTNNSQQSYICVSTGDSKAVELKWDVNETNGYLKSSPLDTLCVSFDSINGGRLDSIKIAAGKKGILTGAIYKFTGAMRPSPLGRRVSEFFTLYSSMTLEFPYSSPYPNWLKIDLTSQNIKTDDAFAVAVGVPDDTSNFAYIMTSTIPVSISYHNYTYIAIPGYKNWYYITSAGNVCLYHIRAYISFPGTNKVIEFIQGNSKLTQNYPNPFNPTTKICYMIEKPSKVTLKIFDVLGREVETLVDEIKDSGTYSLVWQPDNHASGVYYYQLRAGKYNEVRKMVYVR